VEKVIIITIVVYYEIYGIKVLGVKCKLNRFNLKYNYYDTFIQITI